MWNFRGSIMKKSIVVTILLLSFLPLLAQEKTKEEQENDKRFQEASQKAGSDTTKQYGWNHSVITALSLSQISFTDWAQGGTNSLSYVARLRGVSTQTTPQTQWTNSYKFAFGQSRLGGQGLRNTDDEIYFESLLIYKMGIYVNPYIAATLRTQFAKGYNYDDQGNATPSSKFFDPGYLTQSLGVAYQPVTEVTTRLGVGMREVITSQFTLYADDPTTPAIENTKVEGGAESVTDVRWEFAENMLFTSRLQIIVHNDNIIAAKVNQYITTSLSLQLINDVTVTPRTQVKELISLGITYTLL